MAEFTEEEILRLKDITSTQTVFMLNFNKDLLYLTHNFIVQNKNCLPASERNISFEEFTETFNKFKELVFK